MENELNQINQKLALVEEHLNSDNLLAAIKEYRLILKLDSSNISALVGISDCLLKMKMGGDAEEFARRAYGLYGERDDMTAVNYSCVLSDLGNYSEAIEILEKENLKNSTNYLVYNNLGYYYFLTEKFDKALTNYNISIAMNETNPLAYCNRGNLKYFIFNDEDGIRDLERAHSYGDFEAGMILQNITGSKVLLS